MEYIFRSLVYMYSTIHKLFDKIKKMKKIEIFFCDFNFRLMLYFFCFLHIHNTWKSGSGQSHQKKRKKSEAMKFSFLLRFLLNYNFFLMDKCWMDRIFLEMIVGRVFILLGEVTKRKIDYSKRKYNYYLYGTWFSC